MATQPSSHTAYRSGLGPILWGAATALAAAAVVMFIAAGWITLRGQYPDHAQHLAIPLTEFNTAAGKVEQTENGARLTPDEHGVAIVLFDAAPRFPAFQFSRITVELDDATSLRGAEVLWATRQAPNETRSLPLNRDGATLTAPLAESLDWADRINGIGVALITQDSVKLESVTLDPPEPTFGYILTRMWREWTYREGYHGHTINRLRGAGAATLVPIGLAGGLAIFIAGVMWFLTTTGTDWQALRQRASIAFAATLWILLALPWIREVWAESFWAVETYSGKSEAQRKLAEPDAHLYKLAQKVRERLPKEPVRLWLIGPREPQGFSTFERWKFKYYIAPHNAYLPISRLYHPSRDWVRPGDYVLVLDSDHESFTTTNGQIEPGYSVKVIDTIGDNRLFRVRSR